LRAQRQLIGSAIWGALANRAGHRRLVAILMLLTAIFWVPMFFAQGVIELTGTWAIFSLVNPSIASLLITIVSLNTPENKRASVLSMIYHSTSHSSLDRLLRRSLQRDSKYAMSFWDLRHCRCLRL
jgi:predicted MFS family arabinose efflux permease